MKEENSSSHCRICSKLIQHAIAICLILVGTNAVAQNSYDIRFNLDSLDVDNAVACYHMQMKNLGPEDWSLGGTNLSVLYNAERIRVISSTATIVNNTNMEYGLGPLTDRVISTMGTSIPYEDNLGFFRVNIIANVASQGLLLPADSSWVSFFEVCFDILFTDITSSSTCVEINFLNETVEMELNIPTDNVHELAFNGFGDEVMRNSAEDLLPNQSYDACFILEEDTEDLCTDGKDNDEDGLVDCLDSGCGAFCLEDNMTTCNDGIDNDSDGLIDCEDDDCSPLFNSFSFVPPNNCPDLDNGQIQIEFDAESVDVSLDGGVTFVSNTSFLNLDTGTYSIVYRNSLTGCIESLEPQPFILEPVEACAEDDANLCSDGIDNDGDGLVDCADDSCMDVPECMETDMMSESSTSACRDGLDNDNDGLVDCADEGCRFFDFCISSVLSNIYIPNAFSTSSRTNNNRFRISIKDDELLNVIFYGIYDRNGNKVFELRNVATNGEGLAWDGRFNGASAASGVYIYVLQIQEESGTIQTIKGDVTLMK